jgi:phosphatidate cytidylyltransferase
MKTLITRAISALFAVLAVYGLYYFFDKNGFKIIISLGALIGSFELMTILFKESDSKSNKFVFYALLVAVFALCSFFPSYSAIIFAFFCVVYLLFSILILHKFEDLNELNLFQAKSVLGFFYMGLLPSFMIRLLDIPNGIVWFTALLSIVFAGDIGAYLTGMLFGKRKIMPLISPKKTVEGSIGGIIFSMITGLIFGLNYLTHVNLASLLLLAFSTSVVAQFGDFFESVLKRVAEVKDSGSIMPGHGGVLDRVDGVLFGAPIILFGAILLEGILTKS